MAPVLAPPATLTPVVAAPTVLPTAPDPELRASEATTDAGLLDGLDVLPAAAPTPAAPRATSGAGDWLSPEGALRGEFGELVDEMPTRRTAKAPVFPTPPAPWPAVTAPEGVQVTGDAGIESSLDSTLDAEFEALAAPPSAAAPDAGERGASPIEGAPLEDVVLGSTDAGSGSWTPETSAVAIPSEAAGVPGVLDTSIAEAEEWADAYGSQVDAIHGSLESPADAGGAPAMHGTSAAGRSAGSDPRASDWWEAETSALAAAGAEAPAAGDQGAGNEAQAAEPATYLAAEWPRAAGELDPSMLPTPVLGVSAIPPLPPGAGAATPLVPQPAPSGASDEPDAIGGADWSFTSAGAGDELSLRTQPTASSLAAAEALERVAAQLRSGVLRADGYSPALGEAAALSAALAGLLGVDARWDVSR